MKTFFLISLCAFALSPLAADGALNQREAAETIAAEVAAEIGSNKILFVREFRGNGENLVGLSGLIATVLQEDYGVTIQRGAKTEVDGRVLRLPEDESKPLDGFTVRVDLILPSGERRFSVDVKNIDEGFILTGATQETSAPPSDPPRSDPEPPAPPAAITTGTIIRPSGSSPYGVQFLKEQDGEFLAVEPDLQGINPTVKVRKGDLIAMRLHNSSGFDAAVELLVDGMSRFAMAEDPQNRVGLDLIPTGKPREITGWFRDGRVVDSFRIGSYSESVRARVLPEASPDGTITVVFRAAWEKDGDPPPNEPPAIRAIGVSKGPERKDPTQKVEREIGRVRAVVKIFYE